MVKFLNYLALLVVGVEAGLSSLVKIPLSSKQKAWADILLHWESYCLSLSRYLYSAFDLQIIKVLVLPDHESGCWCSEFKTDTCYQHWECFKQKSLCFLSELFLPLRLVLGRIWSGIGGWWHRTGLCDGSILTAGLHFSNPAMTHRFLPHSS